MGIETLKQLVAEVIFPRSDNLGSLATIVHNAFPVQWSTLIRENIGCNDRIELRNHIALDKDKVTLINNCSVSKIRKRLQSKVNLPRTDPFEQKLGITPYNDINPFIVARKVNLSTNLRIFKFRLLHMDIFTKERMFKFKMTANSNCDFCGLIETVRHVLWECGRARNVWETFERICNGVELNVGMSFNNIFIGYNPTNVVLEGVITRLTQMLLRIDRENPITEIMIKNEILLLAKINEKIKIKCLKDRQLWRRVINYLSE